MTGPAMTPVSMTVPARREQRPLIELLQRYRAVFGAAWATRRALAGPQWLADEAAFLPAALSLQATPVHPAPRRAAWLICLLFVATLVWAIVGEIDIVAVAPGRIVVSDKTKVVQPLEGGVVKRLMVKDGDFVRVGQVLIQLDATNAQADARSTEEQLAAVTVEALRDSALLHAMAGGRLTAIGDAAGTRTGQRSIGLRDSPAEHEAAQLEAEWQDIGAKLAKFDAVRAQRVAESTTVRETIAKLQATLPMVRQRETDFADLVQQGFMSVHSGQDRTRERIEQERDLATQRARLAEADAALRETEQERSAYLAETRRTLSDSLATARLKRDELTEERKKTDERARLTELTAPVSGTVQQLAVHTEGGVVTPAQALMVIVPTGAQFTAEVDVDNKDIGFIKAGQEAVIKLDTFPFTKYGTVRATVRSMAADAVLDDKHMAIFPAVLTLAQTNLNVDGKRVNLSPGMSVAAEIKTGKRRIVDFLLRPAKIAAAESLRER